MSAALWAQWPAPARVRAFTTLRHGAGGSRPPFDDFNLGARCGDEAAAVGRNRGELIERFGLPSPPRWLQQVHGTEALRFFAPHPAKAAEGGFLRGAAEGVEAIGDASVTSTPGVVLAILTADCLPVVLANEDGSEVGAAHAGWRGLAGGVLENALSAMHSPAERLIAWLGPAAGPQAYEIGEEVFDAFLAQQAQAESAFTATRPGHWRVDLYALARQRLNALGIHRIHGGDACTISDPQRFFSHRRDARTGRMATVVWMQP